MASKIRTVGVERVHAATYLRKGVEFCEAAADANSAQRYDATVLLAVHAGISASDAICIGLGTRKCADSHDRAADLLEEVGAHSTEFADQAKRLRTLLALKNSIEYENKRASTKEAEVSLRRCESVISWAENQLARAKLIP
ncbi:MAG: hypothetical protein AUJ06_01875 [Chloroflexi bacterium 13_1_40CM_3_70_6]|nr:MAG: hypothetical protein AUJ06_01875 [Chloroflexi bacterium 13_1_40CM_3_70_6]